MLKLKLQYFGHLMWRVDSLEKTDAGRDWEAGGEGDDPGWDGCMASLTWWTWVWVNSGSWWWTGRPGVLRFMGSQRVRHDWATELTEGSYGHWQLTGAYSMWWCMVLSSSYFTVHILCDMYVHAKLLQLCPTLWDPTDCSPSGSSVHGISQARILEWVTISFSRGYSGPRNRTHVFCIAGGFFTAEPSGKPDSWFTILC